MSIQCGSYKATLARWALWIATVVLAFPLSVSVVSAESASSVSQYGITWYFDRPYEVGQYANGDYWVLGPVTITEITPRSENDGGRVINGTQVNPGGGSSQGYDSGNSDMNYSSSRNVAPSMTGQALFLETGSVVSSISLGNPNSSGRPLLRTLAILTVVPEMPELGSFRPHPYGADKRARWNESELDYTILRSLEPVSGTPSLSGVVDDVRRFWNEQNTSWTARAVHASDNQPAYGRDMANEVGFAMLSLHLNYSIGEKRDLYVYLVQQGLDIFGRAVQGGSWEDLGGHNHGRKMPMVLAGLALKDDDILEMSDARSNFAFQEDRQTFYVAQSDVDRDRYTDDGRRRDRYTSDMIGMPEWGEQHTRQPERDGSNWSATYRWVGSGMMGHALMAQLTPGAVDAWNWPAFFDYMDRYSENGSPASSLPNGIYPFVDSMWDAYREAGPFDQGGIPRAPTLTVQ